MKRTLVCVAIVIAALAILSNSTTTAVNRSFAERFAVDDKKKQVVGEAGSAEEALEATRRARDRNLITALAAGELSALLIRLGRSISNFIEVERRAL